MLEDYFDDGGAAGNWTTSPDFLKVTYIGVGTSLYTQFLQRTNNTTCVTFTVGSLIKEIRDNAFSGWSALKTFTIKTEVPPMLGENVFPANLEKIVVPAGTGDTYRVAPGWSTYASLIDDGTEVVPTKYAVGRVEPFVVRGKSVVLGEEKKVVVYDLTGKKVFDGVARKVDLSAGCYVVVVDGKSAKAMLR